MNITFEQLFYGRGTHGYGVLGVSPGAAGLIPRVEGLCGAVGTPGGHYGGEPFLMSVPDGGRIIMVCGRRGAPDSMGRATLLFHVLVAEKDALSAAKADALSLFDQGAFADKVPAGDVAALSLDVGGSLGSGTGGYPQCDRDEPNVTLPCIFRSEGPAAKLVRNAIGNRANELSWTTFAFQSMQGFDVQVLSPRATAARSMNEYDASGKPCRSASASIGSRMDDKPQSDAPVTRGPGYDRRENTSAEGGNVMLKFSIFANIVFAAAIAVLLAMRNSTATPLVRQAETRLVTNVVTKVVDRQTEAPLSDARKAEIEREANKRYLKNLKERFLEELKSHKPIADFDANIKVLPKINDVMTMPNFENREARMACLESLRTYVNFVNEEILKGKEP